MDAANFTLITERLPGLVRHDGLPSIATAPGQCLLLEPAQDPLLPAALYADQQAPGWAVESLFSGTPWHTLATVGPHLVALMPGSTRLAAIVDRLPTERLGIVLCPKAGVSWTTLVEHLREGLCVKGADGEPVVFRWFDPGWLRALLTGLTPAQRVDLAGPFASLIWHAAGGWYQWSPCADTLPSNRQGAALQLDAERLEQLAQERLWDCAITLAGDYARYLPTDWEMAVRRVFDMLVSARQFGCTAESQQERWLRLHLLCGYDFWLQPEASALLASDDLSLAQKLDELESRHLKGTTP